MKIKDVLISHIVMVLAFGCSSDKQTVGDIPCIDIRKNYPEKEIVLTDIADVSYVHLCTEDNAYLYKGGICDITENTIVVRDESLSNMLFFSRDGKPKSHFNRMGQGPQEYGSIDRSVTIVYDETVDEVFIESDKNIFVYSSTGLFKRKLVLPSSVSVFVDFDDQSLFVHDELLYWKKLSQRDKVYSSSQLLDSSFYRISKDDGKVLEYIAFPYHNVDLTIRQGSFTSTGTARRISHCASGLFLFTPESDTVFLYDKDKTLTPIICKTPLVSDLDPVVFLKSFTDIGRYQFIIQEKFGNPFAGGKSETFYYGYDKQTREIFTPAVCLPDYKGEKFKIAGSLFDGKETIVCLFMDLYKLKEAFAEGRLSGKLKELVATLDENKDNEVYALARIK